MSFEIEPTLYSEEYTSAELKILSRHLRNALQICAGIFSTLFIIESFALHFFSAALYALYLLFLVIPFRLSSQGKVVLASRLIIYSSFGVLLFIAKEQGGDYRSLSLWTLGALLPVFLLPRRLKRERLRVIALMLVGLCLTLSFPIVFALPTAEPRSLEIGWHVFYPLMGFVGIVWIAYASVREARLLLHEQLSQKFSALSRSNEQLQLAVEMGQMEIARINFDKQQIKPNDSNWLPIKEWASDIKVSTEHLEGILRLISAPYIPIEFDAQLNSNTGFQDKRYRIMVSEPVLHDGSEEYYAIIQDVTAWKQVRSEAIGAISDRRRLSSDLAGVRQDLTSIIDERERLKEALSHAQRDALTGLANRRTFSEFAAIEWDQLGSMDGRQSALLFMDLDHFKSINDNFGHNVGDSALKHFSAIAGRGLRERDLLGRWGGEEFILLLIATDAEAAQAVAERIRAGLQDNPLELETAKVKMSVSIGVAAFSEDYESLDAWIDAADKAAYEAKNSGRNRVCVAGAAS